MKYIGCYYELDSEGNRIDDFKEWCEADNALSARREFENRYWRAIESGKYELNEVIAQ